MCYMDRVFVQTTLVENNNPCDTSRFIYFLNIYLGINVLNGLKHEDKKVKKNPHHINEFYEKCRNFLRITCKKIKIDLTFKIHSLSMRHILNPRTYCQMTLEYAPLSVTCLNTLKDFCLLKKYMKQ